MMAGLMMVFLLISVVYSSQVKIQADELIKKNDQISEISNSYSDNRKQIYAALNDRFSSRFEEWGAELDKETLTLTFKDPALLFKTGSDQLTLRFEQILSEFWVEFAEILSTYSEDIREVRIEGHTSSEWASTDTQGSYFNNMRLSQERTRTTLQYCYNITPDRMKLWVRSKVTANGMSFSRLVVDSSGAEDSAASRRVEFTVIVDSRSTLEEIGRALND
tara:strand:+ start:562 stop:1221 length:660 start_codon:yes stop_codon:yes gene_type:complete